MKAVICTQYGLPEVLKVMTIETPKIKSKEVLIKVKTSTISAVDSAFRKGAIVTAVCGPTNGDLVKSLGAHYVIDYTKEDYTKNYNQYDIIFDTVGKNSFRLSKGALKEGGVYLTTIPNFKDIIAMLMTKNKSKKSKFIATGLRKNDEKIADLNALKEMYLENKIKPVIDRVFTLEEIIEAHIYVEKGHNKGNVILSVHV